MTIYEAMRESIIELDEIGENHPAIIEVSNKEIRQSIFNLIGRMEGQSVDLVELVSAAIAVGITIGRKVPMVTN